MFVLVHTHTIIIAYMKKEIYKIQIHQILHLYKFVARPQFCGSMLVPIPIPGQGLEGVRRFEFFDPQPGEIDRQGIGLGDSRLQTSCGVEHVEARYLSTDAGGRDLPRRFRPILLLYPSEIQRVDHHWCTHCA